ncbi:hypothetical protein K438DRAFT_1785849 [Mycena galopus ATCC 62051]|nr:hypothetical protein K438DRAFT_1785849 [Mycena galopus ATCC 62051]
METLLDSENLAHFWSEVKASVYDCMTGLILYAMLFLSTAQIVLRIALVFFGLRLLSDKIEGDLEAFGRTAAICNVIYFSEDIVLVTNVYDRHLLHLSMSDICFLSSFVADALFIYRCYLVWGRKICPIILPACMLVVTTVLGYVSAYEDDYHPFGPILYEQRGESGGPGESCKPSSRNPLESGAIYCATNIVAIIAATFCSPASSFPNIFIGAVPQVVNIAPTLITVRVGLAQHVECSCKDSASSAIRMRMPQRSASPGS